jgi:HAMP domain-containing protein
MFVVLGLLALTSIMYVDVLVAKAEIQEQVRKIEEISKQFNKEK